MKVILWRMGHNSLPTGIQLQMRSIPARYDCHLCNREENVEHCFFHCQYVKEIWKELKKDYGICLKLKKCSYQAMVNGLDFWSFWVPLHDLCGGYMAYMGEQELMSQWWDNLSTPSYCWKDQGLYWSYLVEQQHMSRFQQAWDININSKMVSAARRTAHDPCGCCDFLII